MKKLFALVLALVCIFSIAACGKEATPFELYQKATKAIEEANGFDCIMKTTSSYKMGEETQSTDVTYNVKQNGNDLAITVSGADYIDFDSAIYKDGILYISAADSKIKTEMNLEELDDSLFRIIPDLDDAVELPELTAENLKDVQLTKKDGVTSFTVTLNKEQLTALFDEMVAELTETSLFDAKLTMSFDKKGNLKAFEIALSMGMEVMGTEMEYEVAISMEFINLGKAPTINAPADAGDYSDAVED